MTVIDTNNNCGKKIEMLLQRGVTAVGRYYRMKHPEWRIRKVEAQKLSSNGIKIFVVYEDSGHNLSLTKHQREIDGKNALAQVKQIGQPAGSAIYFAAEGLPHGYKASDLPLIKTYFDGVKTSIGAAFELGVYSDGVVCDALLTEGICAYTWLSASIAFEGTKKFYKSGRWSLAQKTPVDQDWDGLSVDENEAKADFGAFAVPTN